MISTVCWEYDGYTTPKGYGLRGHIYTHRAVYEALVGPITEGQLVRHACDNPPCYNPSHLLVGTVADNSADSVARGRARGMNVTECPKGHVYNEANTYRAPGRNSRDCRACNRLSHRPGA